MVMWCGASGVLCAARGVLLLFTCVVLRMVVGVVVWDRVVRCWCGDVALMVCWWSDSAVLLY